RPVVGVQQERQQGQRPSGGVGGARGQVAPEHRPVVDWAEGAECGQAAEVVEQETAVKAGPVSGQGQQPQQQDSGCRQFDVAWAHGTRCRAKRRRAAQSGPSALSITQGSAAYLRQELGRYLVATVV